MEYALHIAVMIGIYMILATSFNLVVGSTGLFSIAHAAFYGIGAYTAAILSLRYGWSFVPGTIAGAALAAPIGALIALPALRIGGDYLVISSFALMMLTYSVFLNWTSLTRGPMGLPGIPQPSILGWQVNTLPEYVLLVGIFAAICLLLVWQVARSPFGRVLRAIRENEVAACALGKNVVYFKVVVVMFAGAVAAIAGSLYAHYITFINPDSFTLLESIFIFCIVIVGGLGNFAGSIGAAVVLIALPEALRFLNVPDSIAGPSRHLLYGALLVFCMRFRPQGLFKWS